MIRGLPSKKIFFLIIACILGVGAVAFASFYSKKSSNNPLANGVNSQDGNSASKNLDVIEQNLKQSSEQDTDGDGLLNWEENLWGTDPKRVDSDNDGTTDGDEAHQNRNPLKAGPNDTLASGDFPNNGAAAGSSGTGSANGAKSGQKVALETTETAEVSRNLFAAYLEAKRLGLPIDEATKKRIVERAVAEKLSSTKTKTYTSADIFISSSQDMEKYSSDLRAAFSAGTAKVASNQSEIDILQNAMKSNDTAELTKLDPIIANYSAILSATEKISVPQEFVSQHVALLNGLSAVLNDIRGFRSMFEDPMLGLVAVGSYYADVQKMGTAMQSISTSL